MTSNLERWELAERKRSAYEATQIGDSELQAVTEDLTRYVHPPADTIHPLEFAFHLLGDVTGKTVLEYGCGDGVNTVLLANRNAHVISLDLSPELVELAQRRVRFNKISAGIDFIVGSAHNLPLPDESVDVVFGIAILHHLDLALSAAEVRRVLRPGGKAIFQEPVRNSALLKAVRKLIPHQAPNISPFERPLTDRELTQFATGYSNYSSQPFELPTSSLFHFVLSPLRRYTNEPLLRFDAAALRVCPPLGYYSPVKVIEMIK
jgi:SAM-dependent methyltransferase